MYTGGAKDRGGGRIIFIGLVEYWRERWERQGLKEEASEGKKLGRDKGMMR